jgi:cellulose synthase/poly-beta-1,6-N-acetylglucosamine synthase-like glycosyltransferase
MTSIIFIYTIVFIAFLNIVRVEIFLILSELYELQRLRRDKKIKDSEYEPLISVLIPAYNEEKVIYRSLKSVYASEYKNFEVIVINDGSKDQTTRQVNKFIKETGVTNLRLMRQKNGGKGTALNNGLKKYAKGELVMILDADSALDKNALKNSVKYFIDPKVTSIASNVKVIPNQRLITIMQFFEYTMGYKAKKALTMMNMEYIIGGAGSVFRKSAIEECGYYDTDTLTEDIDLTVKLIYKKGNKDSRLIYASDVLCYTEGPLFFKSLIRQRFRWKFGRFQTFYKNYRLFFNVNKKYSKTLTWYQLPYAMVQEFFSFIDPFIVIIMTFFAIVNQDITPFIGTVIFITLFTALSIISDDYMEIDQKLRMLMYAPFAYFFFFVIGMIEYIALIQCIWKWKQIFFNKENECKWEHVERAGGEVNLSGI